MDEEPAPSAAGEGATIGLFNKPKRNKNTRKRETPVDDDGGGDGSAVVRMSKEAKANPMVQGTSSGKARAGGLHKEFAQESDRRISNYDNKATATNEQEVERHMDAQAQFERAQQDWAAGATSTADGSQVYRGTKSYHQYTNKAENFDNAVLQGHGPARAPVHYRATSRIDYQPDVCKDFKDTGYCGYGDACKFLHDRSDYKTGWQLEKDFEEKQRAAKHEEALVALGEQQAKPKEEDNLPFACLICREPWGKASNPVVTKCEHYFCESCALRHFQKSRRCFACGEQTGGIFNQAKAIQEKIAAREVVAEAAKDEELSEEQLLAEYEATKRRQARREIVGGWQIQ